MTGTFISYRREDAAGYAGRLRESLERRLGAAQVFRDVDSLQPGQDFVRAIETRLSSCGVMLVVIGREWLTATSASGSRRLDDSYDFVRLEVSAGLARADVLVVPVLVEGASMPTAAELPDDIRLLARRHAVTVRDESWDADVDRLVGVVSSTESGVPVSRPRSVLNTRAGWLLAGVAALVLLAIGLAWMRPNRAIEPGTNVSTDSQPGRLDMPSRTAAGEPPAASYAIDLPRLAEAAFGDLAYSLVSGNVMSRDTTQELRLRVRLSNTGGNYVNFWDSSFRLGVAGDERSPTSNLNEVVPGHSLRYGIVTFALPAGARQATLRVINGNAIADLPLDVSPTGRPAADEQAAVADSLAQAVVRDVSRAPVALANGDLRITLDRMTSRRFVNATRLTLTVKVENRSRSLASSLDVMFRAVTSDLVIAPLDGPAGIFNPMSIASFSVNFELPASASKVGLRTIYRDQTVDHSFELP